MRLRRHLPLASVAVAALALAPAAPSAHGEHVKVFLLAGQSNMLGRADATGLDPALQAPQTDVLLYNGREGSLPLNTLVDLQPGSGTDFGPEITFGRAVADADPSASYALIKYAKGGTNLAVDWSPAGGSMYNGFTATVSGGLAALAAAGHTTEVVGMLWMQGERDATAAAYADAYETNLIGFIADMRSQYGASMPFVIGETFKNALGEQISAAQAAVAAADPLTPFVSTRLLPFKSDDLHLDAAGQQALGAGMAKAWLTGADVVAEVDNGGGNGSASILAHYSFDTDFDDDSGADNHLTVAAGTPTITAADGEFVQGGGALDIDSTTSNQEYLDLAAPISFGDTDAWSIVFWARRRPGTDIRTGMVIGDPSNKNDFVWLSNNPSQTQGVRFRNSSGANSDYDGHPDDGEFHHWAIIADGEGHIEVYRDDESLGVKAATTTFHITSVAQAYNNTVQSMDGQIDELYIFDGAIDAATVHSLYIPEPTALCLLAFGAAAVVRRRR